MKESRLLCSWRSAAFGGLGAMAESEPEVSFDVSALSGLPQQLLNTTDSRLRTATSSHGTNMVRAEDHVTASGSVL